MLQSARYRAIARGAEPRGGSERLLMKPFQLILPLAPMWLPLVGSVLVWRLPMRGPLARVRRWGYVAILGLAWLALLFASANRTLTIETQYTQYPLSLYSPPAKFVFDPLATGLSLLLMGAMGLIGLSLMARPRTRLEPMTLALVGMCVAALAAGDLFTLCLAWGAMELTLLGVALIRAPEETIPQGLRGMWNGLLSTVAVIAAAALVLSQHNASDWSYLAEGGAPFRLLMLAALLRLGVYPLPGSFKRRWDIYLASLCAGGALWIRLASLATALPSSHLLITIGGGALLVTGLLAAFAPDFSTALPYILLNGTAAMVLGPVVEPRAGVATALVWVINLTLCLALLRMDVQIRPLAPLGQKVRIPFGIALGSLAGAPLTLGFVAHWLFLRLCWSNGAHPLVWIGAISWALITLPMWPRLRLIRRELNLAHAPRRNIWLAFSCATLTAALLIVLGVAPSLLRSINIDSAFALDLAYLKGWLWPGWLTFIVLAFLTVLAPLPASYFFSSPATRFLQRIGHWLDLVSALLELEWLYLGLARVGERLGYLTSLTLIAIEEAFYLGWTLVWGLVLVLYFLEL